MPEENGEFGNLIAGKLSDLEGNFASVNKEIHKKLCEIQPFVLEN